MNEIGGREEGQNEYGLDRNNYQSFWTASSGTSAVCDKGNQRWVLQAICHWRQIF